MKAQFVNVLSYGFVLAGLMLPILGIISLIGNTVRVVRELRKPRKMKPFFERVYPNEAEALVAHEEMIRIGYPGWFDSIYEDEQPVSLTESVLTIFGFR